MPIITPMSPAEAPNAQQGGQSSRERAIAKLHSMQQSQQTTPVQNPSSVSPEEMGAITSQAPSAKDDSQGQKDTIDSASTEAPKEATPEKDEPLSNQYAVLARKEKALRGKLQELRTREDAVKALEAQYKAKDAEYGQKFVSKETLLADPLSALEELGLSWDELTQHALNRTSSSQDFSANKTVKALEAKIKALEDAQSNSSKSLENQQKQQYEQAVNQIRSEAKSLIQSSDEFETVRETGSVEDVVDLIKRTFDEDGVLMSVDEAAKAVEDYLIEEALKVAKLKKIQQKLNPAPKPSEPAPKQPQQMKTLTNAVSSPKPLSAKERALLAFKGQLNK